MAEVLEYHEGLEPLRPAGKGKKGSNKRRPGHSLASRFRDFKTKRLRFLHDPGVPFTNNQAEQDLRMKISGAFHSAQWPGISPRCAACNRPRRSKVGTESRRSCKGRAEVRLAAARLEARMFCVSPPPSMLGAPVVGEALRDGDVVSGYHAGRRAGPW